MLIGGAPGQKEGGCPAGKKTTVQKLGGSKRKGEVKYRKRWRRFAHSLEPRKFQKKKKRFLKYYREGKRLRG